MLYDHGTHSVLFKSSAKPFIMQPENRCLFFYGILWDEFEHLYRTLFTNSESHIKAVEALSRKTGGSTRNERIKITKTPANGSG